MSEDLELIHAYTRAQAIADGTLVDVTAVAAEAGFVYPVAVTCAVWEDCVAWTDADTDRTRVPQDASGRLWEVLYVAAHVGGRQDGPTVRYTRLAGAPRRRARRHRAAGAAGGPHRTRRRRRPGDHHHAARRGLMDEPDHQPEVCVACGADLSTVAYGDCPYCGRFVCEACEQGYDPNTGRFTCPRCADAYRR